MAVADELEVRDDLFARDLGPELIRLILEKSGTNLQLLVGGSGDTPLGVAVEAVVESLKNTAKGDRISSDTVVAVVRAGIRAAAVDIDLLKKVPAADADT